MNKQVRVRFAPSPTGPLHIGGVRTALFNYLFARKNNGVFYLRIEDTDQSRFVEGAEQYIIDALNWLGISFDEGPGKPGEYGPYKQSERKAIYGQYARQLIEQGHAYYAFDTAEELEHLRKQYEAEKKTFAYDCVTRKKLVNSFTLSETEIQKRIEAGESYVIRFKMPEGEEVVFTDLIRGEVRFKTSLLDDKIIFKSDGMPTYHLANVVDDFLMKTSHVIRGEEWLPSTPLHILLYRSLGWEREMPQFAHLPLILKPGGQGKLSKRDGDKMGFPVFPLQWTDPVTHEISSGYREDGYFPEAVINILALLGWNPGTEQEFFTLDELIQLFEIDKVQKAGARFDPIKAKWFNQHYFKQQSNITLANLFLDILKEKGINCPVQYVEKVVSLVKERAIFVKDLWDLSYYFFIAPEKFDEKVITKYWKENIKEILKNISEKIMNLTDFTSSGIERFLKDYIEQNRLSMSQVMNCLRLALVGTSMGPHINEIIELLGKEETVKRIQVAINTIK